MSADDITIVTKNTPQVYTNGTDVSEKGTVLNVAEIDSNFINLKQGILDVESLVNSSVEELELAAQDKADLESPVFTGTPVAPTAATGTSTTQIATTQFVINNLLPTKNKVESNDWGNIALYNSIANLAPLNSPAFTGRPNLAGTTYDFDVWNGATGSLAPVQYVKQKLERLTDDVHPRTSNDNVNLGTASFPFQNIYLKGALVATQNNVDLGTSTQPFRDLYLSGNTLRIGDASVSADGTTLVMPVNTALGSADNVIPRNLAATEVDAGFSQLTPLTTVLRETFTASGVIQAGDAVAINEDGTVSSVSNSDVTNLAYIGISENGVADGNTLSVIVHGPTTGLNGFTVGEVIYLEEDGEITETKSETTVKIGYVSDSGTVFLFSTSKLDTYLLNEKKTEFSDFSVTTETAAENSSLTYSEGVFTFTPVDLAAYATESYVDTAVSNLVDSAPAALDTLNELAAALGDDANFSSTVTSSLGLKAPIASPTFTGTPTAPTPASGDDSTKVATTEFVQNLLADFSQINLSSFSVGTEGAASGDGAITYNSSTGVFTYYPPDLSSFVTQTALNDITDVSTSSAIAGQVLTVQSDGTYAFEDTEVTFDGAFSSLTGVPTTISGYGITDAFSGNYNDLTNKPILFTGDYDDLTNKPSLFSGSYNDLTNKPSLFDGAFSSLTGTPTTIAGYGITDAFDGSYSSLTGTPTIPSNLGDLTDISDSAATAGQVLTVQSDGTYAFEDTSATFSGDYNDLSNLPTLFSGNYNDLTNKPTLFSGSYLDLTNTPTIPSDVSDLTDTTSLLFSGNYNDLTNKPTGLATETYVDTAIANLVNSAPTALDTLDELAAALGDDANFATTVTNSLALKANTADLSTVATGGTLGDLTDISDSSATTGQVLTVQSDGTYAFDTAASGGGASVTVSTTAPSNPSEGDLWFDSEELKTYVYYYDGSTYQWVQTNPTGSGSGATTLEGLTDVSYSSATTGQVLTAQSDGTYAFEDVSTFDGAFSSLTGTPTTIAGYGITDAFDGDYNSLSNTPTLFDGQYSSLTGAPTIPTNLGDLGDISDSSATTGQVLTAQSDGTYAFADTSSATNTVTYDCGTAITTNEVVVLNSDGTVSPIEPTNYSANTGIATGNITSTSASTNTIAKAAAFPDSDDKVVTCAYISGTWKTAVVTKSGSSVSYGTEYSMNSMLYPEIVVDPWDSTNVVLIYTGDDNNVYIQVGSISGSSITWGTAQDTGVGYNSGDEDTARYKYYHTDSASGRLTFYSSWYNGSTYYFRKFDWDGSTATVSSTASLTNPSSYNPDTSDPPIAWNPGRSGQFAACTGANSPNASQVFAGTVNWTSASVSNGSAVSNTAGVDPRAGGSESGGWNTYAAWNDYGDKLVTFINGTNYGDGSWLMAWSVSSNTLTKVSGNFSFRGNFGTQPTNMFHMEFLPGTEYLVSVDYSLDGVYDEDTWLGITRLNGTSFSQISKTRLDEGRRRYTPAVNPSGGAQFTVVGAPSYHTIRFGNVPYTTSNLTAESLIGIAASDGVSGGTVEVTPEYAVHFNLDSSQALIPGDTYYVHTDGSLNSTADSNNAKLGVALLDNAILLDFNQAVEGFSGSYNDLTDKPTIPSVSGLASETYVDTAIANLVDTAPSTLDTLNELAAALGDDASFSTTVTNSLALKANSADLATVATTGDYDDLTNKPTLVTSLGGLNDVDATASTGQILTKLSDGTFGFDDAPSGSSGGGTGITWVYKNASYTASAGEGVLCNTDNQAFTITLPASPSLGDEVVVADAGGSFSTNNLTVGRNSQTIAEVAEDLVLDLNNVSVRFIYDSNTWQFYVERRSSTDVESAGVGIDKHTYTATQGQTTFNVNYTGSDVLVYRNGIKIATSEYTATTGTNIVLSVAADADDVVEVVGYEATGISSGSETVTTGKAIAMAIVFGG